MMYELALFSGAGGGLLGTHLLGWRPVGYVEINTECQRIIKRRIDDGILPTAPIFSDVRAFASEGYAASYTGMVDVITAGFPCQPFSTAGNRLGEADERNLWPETLNVIRVVRPKFAFMENVPGLLSSGYFGTLLGDLAESGYDARWRILSAAELGAPHKRDRLWIVVYPNRNGREKQLPSSPHTKKAFGEWDCRNKSERCHPVFRNATEPGLQGGFQSTLARSAQGDQELQFKRPTWWEAEPGMGRVVNGVAHRVDRLKALGNGQVPAVVRAAWELLTSCP